jgi:hypothetical protein
MATNGEVRLEAIKRELELQDREWAQAMDTLARMGDALLAIPQAWLDEMDLLVQPSQPAVAGIRA